MWNNKKSILLSKLCVGLFILSIAVVMLAAPALVHWLFGYTLAKITGGEICFYLTIYGGGASALLLLGELYRVLVRIGRGQVFVPDNVAGLRHISWFCFLGGAIGLASGFYYFPWALVGAAAAFMGLIVRVVKNVFGQAVRLQQEVDYTI